jgi:hypothetical protein
MSEEERKMPLVDLDGLDLDTHAGLAHAGKRALSAWARGNISSRELDAISKMIATMRGVVTDDAKLRKPTNSAPGHTQGATGREAAGSARGPFGIFGGAAGGDA